MTDDFFPLDVSDSPATYDANEVAKSARKRRRSKLITLVALGSVAMLATGSCALYFNDNGGDQPDSWQGADGGDVDAATQVAGTDSGAATGTAGQVATTRSRGPSIWPWMWFMSRGGGLGGRSAMGPTSGFAGSSDMGSGPSRGAATSTATGGSSRSGFGSIGSALSGLT